MILVAYRHGLRASEICDLSWDAIDFNAATMHVTRKKHGQPATDQIRGDELRALRKLHKEQEPKSAFVFTSESGGAPFTRDSFNWMVKRGRQKGPPPLPGPCAHDPPRHRLQAGQCWQGHEVDPGLPRPQGYPAHRSLHGSLNRFKNFWPD